MISERASHPRANRAFDRLKSFGSDDARLGIRCDRLIDAFVELGHAPLEDPDQGLDISRDGRSSMRYRGGSSRPRSSRSTDAVVGQDPRAHAAWRPATAFAADVARSPNLCQHARIERVGLREHAEPFAETSNAPRIHEDDQEVGSAKASVISAHSRCPLCDSHDDTCWA